MCHIPSANHNPSAMSPIREKDDAILKHSESSISIKNLYFATVGISGLVLKNCIEYALEIRRQGGQARNNLKCKRFSFCSQDNCWVSSGSFPQSFIISLQYPASIETLHLQSYNGEDKWFYSGGQPFNGKFRSFMKNLPSVLV